MCFFFRCFLIPLGLSRCKDFSGTRIKIQKQKSDFLIPLKWSEMKQHSFVNSTGDRLLQKPIALLGTKQIRKIMDDWMEW